MTKIEAIEQLRNQVAPNGQRASLEAVSMAIIALETENEPAPATTDTSSKTNNLQVNDSTLFSICQEGLLKIIDRILSYSNDADMYAVGYLQAIYDVLEKSGNRNAITEEE